MLQGKVAIVTGGTRGIGLAIVKSFLDNGAKVAMWGSKQSTVDSALEKLSSYGDRVIGMCPNLCEPHQVENAMNEIRAKWGSIDVLANNAGVSSRTPLNNYSLDEFENIININIKGLFVCSQAASKIMKEQHKGVIINTSSMVSGNGQPSGCAYPASKFAVDGLTKSLARELAKDGIRVNAVAPGITRTDMLSALPEQLVARISEGIPLGRVGEPEDVANAFVFLASEMASYVTGTIIRVDGAAIT